MKGDDRLGGMTIWCGRIAKMEKKEKAMQFVKVVKFSGTTREKNNLNYAAGQGYK